LLKIVLQQLQNQHIKHKLAKKSINVMRLIVQMHFLLYNNAIYQMSLELNYVDKDKKIGYHGNVP